MKIDFNEIIEEKMAKQSYKKQLLASLPAGTKLIPVGHGEYLAVREMTEESSLILQNSHLFF